MRTSASLWQPFSEHKIISLLLRATRRAKARPSRPHFAHLLTGRNGRPEDRSKVGQGRQVDPEAEQHRPVRRRLVTAVGDEGGFAPNLKTNTDAVDLIVEAIGAAGYKPGKDIAIALDPAASEFYEDGSYVMKKSDGSRKTPAQLVDVWSDWAKRYPIVSLEDGMGEEDHDGWLALTKALGE